ncbi:MAG: hypothetical protein KDA84_19800, partial [Planctomycetaceae bacterium]|nr:hypothetical protein [Planctomycetaceae bacterium]
GLHFCGPAFYHTPLVEGFQSLAMMYPVVVWLARWLAVGDQRDHLSSDDISQALAIADHHHGYSPSLGTRTAHHRVRQLSQLTDISKLCRWYGATHQSSCNTTNPKTAAQ